MIDAAKIRADFPILNRLINNKPIIYLDSTASSLKPKIVVDTLDNYYYRFGVNIFRGVYKLSEEATVCYEEARETIAKFIGSKDGREVVFLRNATEAMNLIAYSWGRKNIGSGDEIISTVMEHHANIVPWQELVREKKAKLKFIDITNDGFLDLKSLDKLITKKTKLVTLTFVSNVLGTINPVQEIVKIIKDKNSKIIVLLDAAQAVPHMKIDVSKLGCDFLAFSGHKMLGPSGIGVLWGKFAVLEEMPPFLFGGEMIKEVYLSHAVYADPPHKFEAGTPHIAGAIGLAEAVKYLEQIGLLNIRNHEISLTGFAMESLLSIKNLTLYGPKSAKDRGGVIAFNLKGVHPHDLAQVLDDDNICIRSGHHCAMPLHIRLKIPASSRASFYVYNTKEDVEKLISGILKAKKLFS